MPWKLFLPDHSALYEPKTFKFLELTISTKWLEHILDTVPVFYNVNLKW